MSNLEVLEMRLRSLEYRVAEYERLNVMRAELDRAIYSIATGFRTYTGPTVTAIPVDEPGTNLWLEHLSRIAFKIRIEVVRGGQKGLESSREMEIVPGDYGVDYASIEELDTEVHRVYRVAAKRCAYAIEEAKNA